MSSQSPAESQGRAIVMWSWRGTAAFAASAVAATIFDVVRPVALVVALVLFAIGCVVFLAAFATAVDRSRTEAIGIGGLYFLAGSAPRSVRVSLMTSFAVEVVIAFTTASIRVFTSLAFGILVPLFGLALAGLWGARHGEFEPRR